MADNPYRIVINLGEETQGQQAIAQMQIEKQQAQQYEAGQKLLSKVVSIDVIGGYARSYLTSKVGKVALETGSTELQQKATFAMEAVNFAESSIKTTLSTTSLATQAGLGAGTGIGIGLLISLLGLVVNKAEQVSTDNLNKYREDISLGISRQRSGMFYNRSRSGSE